MDIRSAADRLPPKVPKQRQKDLTSTQRRRLLRALQKIEDAEAATTQARADFAVVALDLGIAAVARELGVSHEAVRQRVVAFKQPEGGRDADTTGSDAH